MVTDTPELLLQALVGLKSDIVWAKLLLTPKNQ
jgi:hypothetical protein